MNQSSKRTTTYKQRRRKRISGYTKKNGTKVESYLAHRKKKTTRTITIKPRAKTKTKIIKAKTKRVKDRWRHYREITWIWSEKKKRYLIAKNVKWKPTRKMYRISLTINYVLRGEYLSYKIQSWATNKKDFDIPALEKRLMEDFEKHLGYTEDQFWISPKFPELWKTGLEEPTKVTYKKNLIGEIESGNEELPSNKKALDHKLSEYKKK